MDPNFIHLDWERTFDAIMLVAVLAIYGGLNRYGISQNRL